MLTAQRMATSVVGSTLCWSRAMALNKGTHANEWYDAEHLLSIS